MKQKTSPYPVYIQGFGTMVATFKTEERAGRVAERLKTVNRRQAYPDTKAYLTRVAVPFMAAQKTRLRRTLKKMHPENIRSYSGYQELQVTVEVPHGLTGKSAALVLDFETADTLKLLRKLFGPPQVTKNGETDTWQFRLTGHMCCRKDRHGQPVIYEIAPDGTPEKHAIKGNVKVLFESI